MYQNNDEPIMLPSGCGHHDQLRAGWERLDLGHTTDCAAYCLDSEDKNCAADHNIVRLGSAEDFLSGIETKVSKVNLLGFLAKSQLS